jgi:predicted Zn-dependent peptidase
MTDHLFWKKQTLSNNLKVLTYPRSSGLTSQLSIVFRYGSNFDSDENAGTAHFLEHLIAGGSKKRVALSRGIESLGGCLDFFTTHDYTMIKADIAPEKIMSASKILQQIAFDQACFQKESFEQERKIILHEIAEISDDPWATVEEMLANCLYKTHPVRRPVSGFRRTIKKLNQTEVEKIHKFEYIPGNAILVLTGKFSDHHVDMIMQNFESEGNIAAPEPILTKENGKPTKLSRKKKPGIFQSYLSIGAKTVPGNHPDIPALELINAMLGGGASSRLFIELREKRALAYNIQSFQECGLDYGYFHIDCAVKSGRIDKAENLIHTEIAKIRNNQVKERELAKVKNMIFGAVYREIDSPTNLPETLTSMEMLFGKEKALVEYIQKINVATIKEVTEVANKYLQHESFSKAIIYPKK